MRPKGSSIVLLLLVLIHPLDLHADTFRWTDENGVVHLSNQRDRLKDLDGASAESVATVEEDELVGGYYEWVDADGMGHITNRFETIPVDRRSHVVWKPIPGLEAIKVAEPKVDPEEAERTNRSVALTLVIVLIGAVLFGFLLRLHRMRRERPTMEDFIDGFEKAREERGEEPDSPLMQEKAVSSHYELLGVSPQAPSSEVRKAYHRLMSEYHPDKVANLGEELRELADKKAKEINAAYEAILFARGEG